MKYTPIIVSTPMVPMVLDGTKTQTRRTYGLKKINECPDEWVVNPTDVGSFIFKNIRTQAKYEILCPYGQAGDRLWVRETWRLNTWILPNELSAKLRIWIDYKEGSISQHEFDEWPNGFDKSHRLRNGKGEWHPSIFMPRWASRIDLENAIDPIPQRLQEISEEDARAEGFNLAAGVTSSGSMGLASARYGFMKYWDSLNAKKYPRLSNPWVWPISFRRLEQ